MTAEYERRLLARAHALADTEDLAEEVTSILGGGRAARLDPDALTSLAAAALALGAGSVAVYQAEAARFASDRDLLDAVEEAGGELAAWAQAERQLRSEVNAALAAARAELKTARDALDAARAMPVNRPCDGCHQARADAIAAAQERIAYCEAALGVLDPLATRLQQALTTIRRVPDDLDGTYEQVYDHVRAGRVMPKDGDFIVGEVTGCHRPGAPAGPTVPSVQDTTMQEAPAPDGAGAGRHEYWEEPDDKYGHLFRPRCSCGWRLSGFVPADLTRSFYSRHLTESARQRS